MALKLRIISEHYKQLGKLSSRLFGVNGGRIGRSRDNDWILPDPDRYISSHHATVKYNAGAWILEDTSTNGIFLNNAEAPLSQEGPYALKDGDRLRMGDYDILVSIDERSDFPPEASGQIPLPAAIKAVAPNPKHDVFEELDEELDIRDLFTATNQSNEPDAEIGNVYGMEIPVVRKVSAAAGQATPSPASSDEGHQQTVVHGKRSEEWHMATRPLRRSKLESAPARSREPERNRSDASTELHAGVEAFCRGAGVDPAAFATEAQVALLTMAGQMMREVVLGLMEALKGRSDLKGRFHINQTTIQPNDNNPLKFSASVDEALRKLLDSHGSRYLGPVESLRDAFSDIKTHQLAVSGAMQAAVDEIMNRLDPTELQERFDRGLKRGPLLGTTNKMKYWDLYTEFYQVLNQRDEQSLPPVFSEEFTKIYAERVAGFNGQRKKSQT